ncbi:MAG: C4-dicarboxylate TRAP transporter substrate-binding protein [Dictyoglomus thermophilum]|uniref:DctP family TRAP transporter solute-binding subunit n=1 Tax=Dictyoglomus thermophilum TaxID=14 RepID=A0A7V3ZK87_DICTH|nr:C4-dicarboxylate TRAP transporter substrate-binding protein [Dictyoglomus thermophilum]MCX7720532.1 C4-dicarboxylate TRAP transporter substrate-binding protein [Dictyoglomus thermophilum]TYT24311.1 DctP family TRAP transporter solute-binding subunit [Dictyoglomus thermophilum]
MKNFKRFLMLGLLVLLLLAVPLSAQTRQFVLKFNHVLSPLDPYHEGFLKWAKAVEERTKGGLKIEVYHSAQLGVEEDILEQIRQGANVGQNTDAARMAMYIPEIGVMNCPYFVDSPEEVAKLKKMPTVHNWLKTLEEKYGFKVLSFTWIQGFRHFMTNKPIKEPEDLKGLRIRTPGTPVWQESIRALGATPVALAFGDVYPALQQKAIDGVELVYNNIPGMRLYEVLKYVNETRHILLINFEVVSAKWFRSLPPTYQKILEEECDKAGLETTKVVFQKEEEVKKMIQEKGMIIVPTKDIDLEAFKKAGEKAYEVLKVKEVKDRIWKEMRKK